MNRRQMLASSLAGLSGAAALFWFLKHNPSTFKIRGIAWQPDNATIDIDGNWDKLGITELLVQWSVVDDIAFIPNTGLSLAPHLPDWQRIARQPWAQSVIMGLAGRFQEPEARQQLEELTELSLKIQATPLPLNIRGWYFPVEADPTWNDAPKMATALSRLKQPVWISAYDNTNIGAKDFTNWLTSWLPSNVGVLFQDGVGVHAREASVARQYADALYKKLGANRLRIIIEAFRPMGPAGFRPASVAELLPQIEALQGYELYLYDGPHYLNRNIVNEISSRLLNQ
ncbi:DUF4434 domain-containing protein [Microvirga sp. W0021]|uniref:DUF4434 domain-containing protein n=1 Tax=Hohaiivirga grylli TaxID=3133970 RepID=A0ABV0BI31_9HYPH